MSKYIEHAEREFEAAGWTKNGKWIDHWQEKLCANVCSLLDVFAEEHHSGSTAVYTLGLFNKLVNFQNIAPLTGSKKEWMLVGRKRKTEPAVWQSRRNSEAFSNDGGKTYYLLNEGRKRDGTPRKLHSTQPASTTKRATTRKKKEHA